MKMLYRVGVFNFSLLFVFNFREGDIAGKYK